MFLVEVIPQRRNTISIGTIMYLDYPVGWLMAFRILDVCFLFYFDVFILMCLKPGTHSGLFFGPLIVTDGPSKVVK